MAASTGISVPIVCTRTPFADSGSPSIRRMAEKATQTFLQGTPVQVDVAGGTGFIIACPVMNNAATALVAGISVGPGSNLTVSGTPKTLNTGFSVQNQPNAVVIPIGAPIVDGNTGFYLASDTNEFIGVMGDSANDALAVLAQAQVGAIFGLFKDPGNSFWYVDHNVTTVGTGACVEIIKLIDAIGTLHGRVLFRFTKAAQQLQS